MAATATQQVEADVYSNVLRCASGQIYGITNT